MPLLSSINKCSLQPYTMFPAGDSNSFTVPYSDQFLLYSTLLDDAEIDDYNNNPYSPFSFYDQNMPRPFFSSDDQQLEHQNSPLVQHHEEEEPMLTVFEEFTMDDTSCNNRTSMWGYCATENFHHNGLASDPTNGISTSAVGVMKIYDKVSKNVNFSKKDRHSKINTAQGPRDRRMRLSLDIAKRFFGLQDMLGFDKASKTVDWLLSKSQSEINKVAGSKTHDGNNVATKSGDSFGASECCEEVSEVVNKDDISQSGDMNTNIVTKKSSTKTKASTAGKVSVSLRNGFNNLANKESREKARARARERTKEKMMLCTGNANRLSNMDQNMRNQVLGPHAYSFVDQGRTMTNQDYSRANTLQWNPSSSCTFDNLQQQISGTSHQLPFEDLQFYATPWESYN